MARRGEIIAEAPADVDLRRPLRAIVCAAAECAMNSTPSARPPETLSHQCIVVGCRVLALCLGEHRGLTTPPVSCSVAHALRTHAGGLLLCEHVYQELARLVFAGLPPNARSSHDAPWLIGHWLWNPARTPDLGALAADTGALDAVLRAAHDGLGPDEYARADPQSLGGAYESLLALTLHVSPAGARLEPTRRSRRKRSGAFYTPEPVVQGVLDSALDPVVERRLAGCPSHREHEDTILAMRVCDPAVGSGRFLRAAAHRLARAMTSERDGRVDPEMYRAALREVVTRCLLGVDLDPVAAELCRIALWLEAADPSLPWSTLESNIRVGHALLGAPPEIVVGLDAATAGRVADAWCASFFLSKGPTTRDGRALVESARVGTLDDDAAARIETEVRDHACFHWHLRFPEVFRDRGGFDVVVGNPPFLNQLESATAAGAGEAALIRARTGGAATGYADTAGAFLALGARLIRDGGRASLVQPQSLLAARDGAGVRRAVLEGGTLTALWIAGEHVFDDASVHACAPTIERTRAAPPSIERRKGLGFVELPPLVIQQDELAHAETWAPIAAAAAGIPEPAFEHAGELSVMVRATADFRDQYYGLDGFLVEDADLPANTNLAAYPRLVTAGLIDPAACRWGDRATRILGRSWRAPRVDRARMARDGTLAAWITARLVPKVVLATQTRVLEPFVDESGEMVPSIPLITIEPERREDAWLVAAALCSPVCTAVAMQRYAGTAFQPDAIKLAARQVLTLPLPAGHEPWARAADAYREAQRAHSEGTRLAHLERAAGLTCDAYRVPEPDRAPLLAWWTDRLHPRRRSRARSQ